MRFNDYFLLVTWKAWYYVYMRYLMYISMTVSLLSSIAQADLLTDVEQQILHASGSEQMALANEIVAVCLEYTIDCHTYTAMLAYESMYHFDAVNSNTHDYGISQINIKSIKAYKLDKNLLVTDRLYSLRAGAKILKWFQTHYKHKEPQSWYCRYNVGVGSLRDNKLQNCIKYIKGVQAYRLLKKLKKETNTGVQ